MRLGIAHHLGWAIVVAASADGSVIDRRRIELVGPDLPNAPVHHEGGAHAMHRSGDDLDDAALAQLVAAVRASAVRAAAASLDDIATALDEPVLSVSVRDWPDDFPGDIATLRRVPYESRADSVMYCQVLAEVGRERGWAVHRYDAKTVEADAGLVLGAHAEELLHGPRARLGPPWTKDHRMALAATVVAAAALEGSSGTG